MSSSGFVLFCFGVVSYFFFSDEEEPSEQVIFCQTKAKHRFTEALFKEENKAMLLSVIDAAFCQKVLFFKVGISIFRLHTIILEIQLT